MKLYYNNTSSGVINEQTDSWMLDEKVNWFDYHKKHKKSGYEGDDGTFHPCHYEDLNDRDKFLSALAHNRAARFAWGYGVNTDFLYDPKKGPDDEQARRMRSTFIGTGSKYNKYDKLWIDDIADRPVMAKLRVSGHPFVFGSWAKHNDDCDCCLNILLPDENGRLFDADKNFYYDYRCDHQIIALSFKYDMFHPTKEAEQWMRKLMANIMSGQQPHVSIAEIKAKIDPHAKVERSSMYELRPFNYEQSPNLPRKGERLPWKHEEEAMRKMQMQQKEMEKQARRQVNQANSPQSSINMSDINRAWESDNAPTVVIKDKDTGAEQEYLVVSVGRFNYLYDADNDKAYYYKKNSDTNLNTAAKRRNLEVKINMNEAFRRKRRGVRLTESRLRLIIRSAISKLS